MDLTSINELKIVARVVADFQLSGSTVVPLMVGATARDVLLHYDLDVPLTRATYDIDLAFAVADWEEFDFLRASLIKSGLFEPERNRVHRLIHVSGLPVDLVPFGGVESSDRQIEWPHENTIMNVLGYREARESAIHVKLPEDQAAFVVSLPMLALLKLYAWFDRHIDSPRKDAQDLFLILLNYLKGENANRIYTDASRLLDSDEFDFEIAGGWLAGYDVTNAVTRTSERPELLMKKAREILEEQINADGRLQLVSELGRDADRCLKLLTGFYEGLVSNIDGETKE